MQLRTPVPDLAIGDALRVRPAGITTVGLAIRIAFATTASYFIARQISGSTFVLFAPVTTLLVVQASPFATLGASLQRVLGTGLGVLAATVYVQFVGINAITFFVAIAVALLVARLLPVSLATQLQIPVAVVFVLALGTTGFRQDLWRVLDVAIGGLVGVAAVYAWPGRPDITAAVQARDAFRHALSMQLRRIGREVGTLPGPISDDHKHEFTASSRALRKTAASAREEYANAAASLRFHPRARRVAQDLDEVGAEVAWLSGLAVQIRALSGAADRLYDRDHIRPALPADVARELFGSCGDLLDAMASDDPEVVAVGDGIRARIAAALDVFAADRVSVVDILQSVSLLGRLDLLVDSVLRPLGQTGPGGEGDDEGDEDHRASAPASGDR